MALIHGGKWGPKGWHIDRGLPSHSGGMCPPFRKMFELLWLFALLYDTLWCLSVCTYVTTQCDKDDDDDDDSGGEVVMVMMVVMVMVMVMMMVVVMMMMVMMMQEREALEDKQAWYQHVHPSDVDREKEYIAFCSDAKLRLHVAELRLNRSSTPLPVTLSVIITLVKQQKS